MPRPTWSIASRNCPTSRLRWRNKVTGLAQRNDRVVLTIDTPDGPYALHAAYVIACDGARSSLRQMVGAEFAGQVFEDQFLIADVKMTAAFPTERWFWFDPPFHAGRSALLHKQPDDIWRIDLQLSPDADPGGREAAGERAAAHRAHARPRQVRVRMDLALQIPVPPHGPLPARPRDLRGRCRASGLAVRRARRQFGTGGCGKSGLEARPHAAQDVAGALLESYHIERSAAADENIRKSTRSTDFMAPATRQEARLRKAVLALAKDTEFGKRMVNGGRLSVPSVYSTPLSTADVDDWRGGPRPGASMPDAPMASRGAPVFLTEAFIKGGTRSPCWRLAMEPRSMRPKAYARSGSAARADWSTRKGSQARATMPSPEPAICCGPMAMSPRASAIRRALRWTPRWPAPPA